MYCVKCGRKLQENGVCEVCGNEANVNQNNIDPIKAYTANNQQNNQQNNTNIVNEQKKSKLAAGLFGIFLGCLGAHNFYLGFTSKAVVQLLLTILSCGLLIPITGIWGLIEGVIIMTSVSPVDSNGIVLRD
ncbi:MAG: TM2 domain-containing protein [Clostridia bacterium]